MNDLRPILIAGPTAGGKSGLALRLAERYGGTIINADSMQVYRELRVLTARPSAAQVAQAPHALYGFVDASERYSAGRYVSDAVRAIELARNAGRRPIIVGGTGLYFKALLEGLSPIPEVPEEIRRYWRQEAGDVGPEALHDVLTRRDPQMAARLAPSDPQRLVRALEVLDATGVSLAEWQRTPGEPILNAADTVRLVIAPEREGLNHRIEARFDAMIEQGALEEACSLAALNLDPSLPIMGALGVRPLLRHLRGESDLEAACLQAKAESRQYAKRQMTWLRSNMIAWNWISAQENKSQEANSITFIDS